MLQNLVFSIECPCGCSSVVAAEEIGGFAATTVVVSPCEKLDALGASSYEIRKSVAYQRQIERVVARRHRSGLVDLLG